MHDPETWTVVAERVGIPFTILLMVFFFLGGGLIWLSRYVVRPLVSSLLGLVESVKTCNESNSYTLTEIAKFEKVKAKHFEDMVNQNEDIKTLLKNNNNKLDVIIRNHNGKSSDKLKNQKES